MPVNARSARADGPVATGCVGRTVDPTNEFLAAKEAAYWAASSALAAWLFGALAIIVNAVGLYFVWRQLKGNREALSAASVSATAAADAAKVAFMASRPWIKFQVHRAYLYLDADRPDQVGCQIDYQYENIGQTPAVQVGVVYKPVPQSRTTDYRKEFAELLVQEPQDMQAVFPGEVVQLGPSRRFPFAPVDEERWGISFAVVAAVKYRAHASGEIYWTPLMLQLQQSDPKVVDHRIFRGMGHLTCLVMPVGAHTPDPT